MPSSHTSIPSTHTGVLMSTSRSQDDDDGGTPRHPPPLLSSSPPSPPSLPSSGSALSAEVNQAILAYYTSPHHEVTTPHEKRVDYLNYLATAFYYLGKNPLYIHHLSAVLQGQRQLSLVTDGGIAFDCLERHAWFEHQQQKHIIHLRIPAAPPLRVSSPTPPSLLPLVSSILTHWPSLRVFFCILLPSPFSSNFSGSSNGSTSSNNSSSKREEIAPLRRSRMRRLLLSFVPSSG